MRDALAAMAIILPTLSAMAILLAAMVAAPFVGFPLTATVAVAIAIVSQKGVN